MNMPKGFNREALEDVADSLLTGYEKTINVGSVTGVGDDLVETSTAYAARFIKAILAAAPTLPERGIIPDQDAIVALAMAGKFSEEQTREIISKAFPRLAAPTVIPWDEVQRISDMPQVYEALSNFAEDVTGDNGAAIVRAILWVIKPTPPEVELLAFDLGLMNNYGGGNVEWWWDYIRDSLRLAHEHYQEQVSDLVNTRTASPKAPEVDLVYQTKSDDDESEWEETDATGYKHDA